MIEQYIGIQPAHAHTGEEEGVEITVVDYAGPVLALLIIVVAVLVARRVRKQKTV